MKQTSPKHRKHVHLGHFVCPEECLPQSHANVFWRIRQSSINWIRTLCQRLIEPRSAGIERHRIQYIAVSPQNGLNMTSRMRIEGLNSAQEFIEKQFGHLPLATRQKILAKNAVKLYRLGDRS